VVCGWLLPIRLQFAKVPIDRPGSWRRCVDPIFLEVVAGRDGSRPIRWNPLCYRVSVSASPSYLPHLLSRNI
jgi:hypothetical protein